VDTLCVRRRCHRIRYGSTHRPCGETTTGMIEMADPFEDEVHISAGALVSKRIHPNDAVVGCERETTRSNQ
jgi:hypothetical protein